MMIQQWCNRVNPISKFATCFWAVAALLMLAAPEAKAATFQRNTTIYNLSPTGQSVPSDISPTQTETSHSNATFELTYGAGLQSSAQAQAAFNAATALWSAVLRDNITIKLDLDFAPLESGILGSTGSTKLVGGYDEIRDMIVENLGETTNFREALLLPNLPTKSQFSTYLPSGFDLDQDIESQTQLTQANYHALGGIDSRFNDSDGNITFSSNFSWDFDPSDGIDSGKYDFVGVAVHEIGHALGFISDVDFIDQTLEDNDTSALVRPTPIDLFRFATVDLLDPDFDFTTSTREMIPGGSDSFYYGDGSALLSTGLFAGDGHQASHWKDNLSIGIMDPTASAGEALQISVTDLIAMDLIGWDVDWELVKEDWGQVPEPATAILLALGAAMATKKRRKNTTRI